MNDTCNTLALNPASPLLNRKQKRAMKFNTEIKKEINNMSNVSEGQATLVSLSLDIADIKNDSKRAALSNACATITNGAPTMSLFDLESAITALQQKVAETLVKQDDKPKRKINFGTIASAPLKGLGWLSGHAAKAGAVVLHGIGDPVVQGYKTGVK